MSKLETYGFGGKIRSSIGGTDTIDSYLSDRQQYISYNRTNTPCLNIDSGVPQVSVLGPFIVLVNINEINLAQSDCKLAIFADETIIIVSNREGCCSFQLEID